MGAKRTVLQCISDSRSLTEAQKAELREAVDSVDYDPATAEMRLSNSELADKIGHMLEERIRSAEHAKFQKQLQVQRIIELETLSNRILRDTKLAGEDDGLYKAINSLLDVTHDRWGVAKYGLRSVNLEGDIILREWNRPLEALWGKFHQKAWGRVRAKAEQEKLFKAVYQRDFSDPEFGPMAKAMDEVIERARQAYNEAGGFLRKRNNYVMPPAHNPKIMARMGEENWIALVNRTAGDIYDANGKLLSGDERAEFLRVMYDNMTTGRRDEASTIYRVGGQEYTLNKLESETMRIAEEMDAAVRAGDTKAGRVLEKRLKELQGAERLGLNRQVKDESVPMANMRGQQRLINFKDADSWIEYQNAMGVTDHFSVFQNHLSEFAKDIAIMQRFGPDADTGFAFLLGKAQANHPQKSVGKGWIGKFTGKNKQIERLGSRRWYAQAMWDVTTGKTNMNGEGNIVNVIAGLRNLATAIFLQGSAVTAVFGDAGTSMLSAAWNGTNPLRVLGRAYSGAVTDRAQMMARIQGPTAGLLNTLTAMNRFTDISSLDGWTAKLADIGTRGSGLQVLTRGFDQASYIETLQTLAENINLDYRALNHRLQRYLADFGIGEDDWAKIQKAGDHLIYYDGKGTVSPDPATGRAALFDLDSLDRVLDYDESTQIRRKLMYAMAHESEFYHIKGTTGAKAITTAGMDQGLGGQMSRSLLQFNTHPVSMWLTHVRRVMMAATQEGAWGIGYAAGAMVGTTMLGAMILQTKEVSRGRDVRSIDPTTDMRFWADALLYGGGFGFWLDIAFTAAQGQEGMQGKMFGPGFRIMSTVMSPASNLVEMASTDKSWREYLANTMADVWGLSPTKSHWGLLWAERLIGDKLVEMADPGYARDRQRNIERHYQNQRGQDYWWRQGDTSPERGPSLNMMGD